MAYFKHTKIPLHDVVDDSRLILTEMSPLYEYINGKQTTSQIGVKADVVDMRNYDKFSVKIMTLNPQITPQMAETSKERMFVRLIDAYAKPYVSNGRVEFSITASDIEPVKKPLTSAAERNIL